MNNTFDFNRFKKYIYMELVYNKQRTLIEIGGLMTFVILFLLVIRAVNEEPIEDEVLMGMFIASVCFSGVAIISRAFHQLRNRKKIITYLTFPISQLEKFIFEYLSTVIVGCFVIPALVLLSYMIEGEVHSSFDESIGYIGLEFITNFIDNIVGTNVESQVVVRKLLAFLILILLPWSAFNIFFTGAILFKKFTIPQTVLAVALIGIFNGFLVYLIFIRMNVKEYISSQQPLFFFDTKDAAMYFLIFSVLLINTAFITSSYLKLKEKEL